MTGFLLRRVRAHRLLLAAALLSVILATSVLAALAAFSTAIGDAGLRRALQHQSASRTVLDVHSDVTGGNRRATGAEIRRAAHRSFDGLPVSVAASTSSGPYALPEALRPADATPSGEGAGSGEEEGSEDEPDLTRFTSLDPRHVRMVAGSWPQSARAGGPVSVAVPQPAAKRLGLRPGDTFEVTSRLSGPPPVEVEVTGVFTPRSPGSPYWRLDPLKGDGVSVLDFTTYGPLAVPDGSFSTRTDPRARDDRKAESRTADDGDDRGGEGGANDRAARENESDDRAVRGDGEGGGPLWPAEGRWQARADFAGVSAARLDALRDHVRRAADRFGSSRAAPDAAATTELPALLDSLERTLLVTRSTLLIAALQLVLLTGLSLLLVAQLLRAERESETALLRARGASRARVCGLAVAESLLLALPAALVAPLLAGPAVRWSTGYGALARAGVEPVVRLPAGIWWVAAGTALGCAVVVALPVLRGRGGAGGEDPENGVGETGRAERRGRRTAATLLRGGADLALVGLAVTAYWQLERRSEGTGVLSSGAAGTGGALGIDPVLVAAPALALLAGTVLVLRLLPLVARAGERGATRGRGLAAALAGWQLSRRPLRGAAPALLLVLAVATGVFAVGQGASWDRSQGDQADFRTGADVATSDSAASALAQGGIYDGTDGVRAVAPVARTSFTVEGERSAQVIATDTRSAADGTLRMRGDLADVPLPRLLRPLASGGRAAQADRGAGLRLPGGTRELRVRVRLDGPRGAPQRGAEERGAQERGGSVPDTQEALTLTLEDRFGVPYRFLLDSLPADGSTHTLTARLTSGDSAPARSLHLTGLALSYAAPDASEERTLTVESLRATGQHGARALHPDRAERWSTRLRADDPQGTLGRGASYARPEPGPARLHTRGAPLTFPYTTGSAPPTSDGEPVPVSLELRPGEAANGTGTGTGSGTGNGSGSGTGSAALPAVATDAYLRATGAKVGDKVTARISDQELTLRLTAAVRALPTEERGARVRRGDAGALLVDLAALDRLLGDLGGTPLEPLGWWLEAEPGAARHVAAQLRAEPAVGTVRVRDEVAAELRGDPLGAGPRSALTAIALAAAVLAATGFAVSVAGAARERAGEFAVLRALGASRRRLAQALAAEQGVLLLLSAALGIALGVLLTRLVVPLIVLTPEATLPVPALLVRLPLGPLALLLAAVLALPALAVTATALRRTDPVAALRAERGD